MEKIITKESTGFLNRFRTGILFDIVFKCLLCGGLIIMWTLYPSNMLVAGTTLIMIVFNTFLIAKMIFVMKTHQNGPDFTRSTTETVKTALDLHAGLSATVPLSWSISTATFYVLGSFMYHHFKYNTIQPFQDIRDVAVLGLFMVTGMVISFISHYHTTRSQFQSLGKLAAEMEDDDGFATGYARYKKVQRKRYMSGIIIFAAGLLLLLALVLFFMK